MTTTREAWLLELVEQLRPFYGGELPEAVRISTGFPSAGKRGKSIGECWQAEAADDKCCQIFIHPGQVETLRVADIVAHELIHACRPDAKHGPKFRQLAEKLGLEGPMKSTHGGPRFAELVGPMIAKIGEYPHARLTGGCGSNGPKQTTRMIKCECPMCGYVVRTTQKWLDVAVPTCPACATGDEMVVS